jgi:hypothetical protein
MAFENLPKGSILYIKATDPLAVDPANNQFTYGGSTFTAPGQKYLSAVATRNGLAVGNKTQTRFRRVTEHNRSEFSVTPIRIERQERMANGSLRKYVIADKKSFSLSWTMLPSFRNETVDGAWGAEDLKAFYESTLGQGTFDIMINPTSFDPAVNLENTGVLADDYTYTVTFTSCDFVVVKRGIQAYWNVNMSMEQV